MNCWPNLYEARVADLPRGTYFRRPYQDFGLVVQGLQGDIQFVYLDGTLFRLGSIRNETEVFAFREPLELQVETRGPIRRAAPGAETGQMLMIASGGLSLSAHAIEGAAFVLVNLPACIVQKAEFHAMFAFDRWSFSLKRPDGSYVPVLEFPSAFPGRQVN
jgi:hypothetical protein